MAAFSLPAFSRLSPKIARAERELEQLEIFFARHSQEVSDGEWVDRIREAFPSFVHAVVRLEKTMAAEDTDDGDGTAGALGR